MPDLTKRVPVRPLATALVVGLIVGVGFLSGDQRSPAAHAQAGGSCTTGSVQDCVTRLMVTANPVLGNILTDDRGNTLYYYDDPTSPAGQDPSSCSFGPDLGRGGAGRTATCLTAWPPVVTADFALASADVTGTVGIVVRPDGQNVLQVTYNGAPLYFFAGDRAPGDTNGQGVRAFGGTWQVVPVN